MDYLKIINVASVTIFPCAVIFLLCMSMIYYNKEKIYRYPSNGWMSVNEYIIPEDIRDFLVTDGKTVKTIYSPKWEPHGKVIFNETEKTYVTYWQPFPEPPKQDLYDRN